MSPQKRFAKASLHLRVLPLFLSAGAHGAEDLPTQVAEAQTMYPQMARDVVSPVGEHPSVVSAIEAIAREASR
jgi:sirohydrochlorin ferrochelatase